MPSKMIPSKHRETMIEAYKSGATAKVAASTFGYSPNACYFALKQAGVPRRSRSEASRIYAVNEEFFDCIDSESKAYWLGFLSADGTVGDCFVRLALSSRDREHVRKFVVALESEHPVVIRGDRCLTHIGSKKLAESLIRLGVVPRKSLILKPCDTIPEFLLSHYWRGAFDGDGGIWPSRIRGYLNFNLSFVGTEEMVRGFASLVSAHVRTATRPRPHSANVWAVRYSGIALPQKVAFLLYSGATVYLERKKKVVESLLALKPHRSRVSYRQMILPEPFPKYEVI